MRIELDIPEEMLKFIKNIILDVHGEDVIPRLITKQGMSTLFNQSKEKVVAKIY